MRRFLRVGRMGGGVTPGICVLLRSKPERKMLEGAALGYRTRSGHKVNSSWLKISGALRPWPEARPIE
jgi:hypothetical protein